MPIQTINPTTGEVVKTFEELTEEQIEAKIAQGQAAFESWKKTSFAERKELLLKLAKHLEENARNYGEVLTLEMGKPIAQAEAEVKKCAWVCEYYAENAESMLAKEMVQTDASESYVRFDPLGIVLAVMPWNYPFWQVLRFAAPAVMAGNVGLLKHASNVPQSAELIEAAFDAVGFPKGVFQNLLVSARKVEAIVRDDRIKAATLTGSEYAGSQVAMQAGEEIKPTVLELGGSDPFIVLADADIEATCEIATKARLQNNGQSCIAAKRFIVVEEVAERFKELYRAKFESQVVGDPMDEKTTIGPLASERMRDEIELQVNKSVEAGAKILTGGKRIGEKGFFYAPTILENLQPGMLAYSEEIFGPVASLIVVKDEAEALRVANDSKFGLGASLWTQDLEKANKLIPQIEAGAVFVNGMVKSDPRLPFGGIKKSGYGRELSHYGIKEFLNIKTVWIK